MTRLYHADHEPEVPEGEDRLEEKRNLGSPIELEADDGEVRIDLGKLTVLAAEVSKELPEGEDASTVHLVLSSHSEYESYSPNEFILQFAYTHFETDAEYAERRQKAEAQEVRRAEAARKRAVAKEKAEREEYERLRVKFEKGAP